MDIDILLALQEFRNGAGSFLTEFFSKMTFLGEINTAIVIMAILYWSVSKELGSYLLMGWSGNRLANGVMKVTACAYRPWIRDARILPHGNAITTAAFVAFSRIYLGVHTPQDVLVGAGIGTLVMWLTLRLMRWVEAHPGKDWLVVCISVGLGAAVALYAALKPYPADYDAEGKLIVDGAKMANDTFKGVGYCVAFLTGWILERRFVGFSTEVPVQQKLMRAVIGLLGYYAVSLILAPLLKTWISGPAGTFISCFIQMFYVAFLFPLCAKYMERSSDR